MTKANKLGLSLSVLRGGGQAGRMERHFDASERGGEGVQGVGKKSYRTWTKTASCVLALERSAAKVTFSKPAFLDMYRAW